MGGGRVGFQIVSDQRECLRSVITGRANYEDEFYSVSIRYDVRSIRYNYNPSPSVLDASIGNDAPLVYPPRGTRLSMLFAIPLDSKHLRYLTKNKPTAQIPSQTKGGSAHLHHPRQSRRSDPRRRS
jgi:hypothetical protein